MAFTLQVPDASQRELAYNALLPQIKSIVAGEDDLIANFANVSAVLRQAFGFFWVGFYRVVGKNELVLGPFQGELACTRIPFGKGVCGEVAESGETRIVDDVNAYSNHIACSPQTQSEIVVPVFRAKQLIAVLDIDSVALADFSETDKNYLEKIAALIDK